MRSPGNRRPGALLHRGRRPGLFQLVVMARWPAPGRCKRRLAVGLGTRRAAAIQAQLTGHVLQVAGQACDQASGTEPAVALELVLAVSGLGARASRRWGERLGADRVVLQGGGGLGLRLQRQVMRALREGARAVVIIGSDLPELTASDLRAAFHSLERVPLVLGPARDGGYWLIGLGHSWPSLFSGMGWGGAQVLQQTIAVARRDGLALELLAVRSDLDHPADLLRWR